MTPDAALAQLPALAAHLLNQYGGIRAKSTERAGTAWEAPLAINGDALDDTVHLWTLMCTTAYRLHIATGATMPAAVATAIRSRTFHLPSDTRAALEAVQAAATWLGAHRRQVEDFWLDELTTAARDIEARWRLRDRRTTAKDAICPDDRGALDITPPRHPGDPRLITCRSCSRVLSEDEYAEAAARFQAVLGMERAQSARVRAHLARKYGAAA